MKTLILSDVHSNIYALEAIWDLERDSDHIYCAGDLVDYGPYPKEVLNWVRSHNVSCVQGNHDAWVVMNYRSGSSFEKMRVEERAWVHHNADLLDENDIRYLEQLPKTLTFELDKVRYCMTHMYQDYEEIISIHAYRSFLAESKEEMKNGEINRLIIGHTHRQAVRYLSDEILWLNPGSVSYRRDDDPDQSAHYAVIEDGIISLKRLAYDLEPLRDYVGDVHLKASEIGIAKHIFGIR